jgi:hypothetical protein
MLTALDNLLIFSCQFQYGTVAAEAASTPDSAEADLVFHVFKAFSQMAFLRTFGVLNEQIVWYK